MSTLTFRDSLKEHEQKVIDEMFICCKGIFDLVIPNSILLVIAKLSSFGFETDILSWDETEWISDKVIPEQCLSERVYYVSPSVSDEEIKKGSAFKAYNSYEFHDCVDEKGPTVFIIDCARKEDDKVIVIGGYCDKAWFSPYKKGKDSKVSNGGYWVEGSTDCKLFALRNDALTKRLMQSGNELCLPLLAKTINEGDHDIMVAANRDGPNFGFNHFYITWGGAVSIYSHSHYFASPVDFLSDI
eukprot:406397_1